MRVDRARSADIAAIAAIFTECFRDSVLHHCGRLPKPLAMEDVFTLVYQTEPAAAFVARDATGTVVGYCFAPTKLSRLWIRAILGGHLCKWAWHWLSGQYGFGLYPIKVLFMNKMAFLRSALSPTYGANARILSIAVKPSWQGRGLATMLMTAADEYFRAQGVRRIRLEVRPDNIAAVKLYLHAGYKPVGSTYDSQGEWLIMIKETE